MGSRRVAGRLPGTQQSENNISYPIWGDKMGVRTLSPSELVFRKLMVSMQEKESPNQFRYNNL